MPSLNTLNLIVDVTAANKKGLLQSFSTNQPASVPLFVRNDTIEVTLRAVQPYIPATRPWEDVDLSSATVELAIGIPNEPPTSGTFTLTYASETSTAIAYNAEAAVVQTALNALGTVTSAGGVTVIKYAQGVYQVTFNTAFNADIIEIDGGGLNPACTTTVSEVVDGDTDFQSVQVIQFSLAPFAVLDSWSNFPIASYSVLEIAPGSVGTQNVQQITLTPAPYAGTFLITTPLLTTGPIPYNATASQVQSALNVGGSNYTVTGDQGGPWTITRTTNGTATAYTVNTTGLLVPVGLSGELSLSTYSMLQQFLAESGDTAEMVLEIQVTEAGGGPATILQVPVTVTRDVINGSQITPSPVTSYWTAAQSDNRYVHNHPNIDNFTGGFANDFDSIVTAGVPRGQLHAAVVDGVLYMWELTTGTAATSAPQIIRPTDYDGSTNQANWILRNPLLSSSIAYEALNIDGSTASTTLDVDTGEVRKKHTVTAATYSGSYSHDLVLANAGAIAGTVAVVQVLWPASSNPTVRLMQDDAVTVIATQVSVPSSASTFQLTFNGTIWELDFWG